MKIDPSTQNFIWFQGVVEDVSDPLRLGRCRVRIIGYHEPDKIILPTDQLPWSHPIQPITSAAVSGVGTTPTGLVPGSHVVGFFRDSETQQQNQRKDSMIHQERILSTHILMSQTQIDLLEMKVSKIQLYNKKLIQLNRVCLLL